MKKALIYLSTGFIFFTMVFSCIVFFLILEDKALVVNVTKPDPETILEVKQSLKRQIKELDYNDRERQFFFHHNQVEIIAFMVNQAVPAIAAAYNYQGAQLLLASSIKLPRNPLGQYINLVIEFTDPDNLLAGSTRLGRLTLSNEFFINLSFIFSSLFLESDLVTTLKLLFLDSHYSKQGISISINTDVNTSLLKRNLKTNLKKYRNLAWDNEQFPNLTGYYQYLRQFSGHTRGISGVSLADYMQALFTHVQLESLPNTLSVEQNTSAIVALGLLLGDFQLKYFLQQLTGVQLESPPHQQLDPVLGGRHDLMLHFIYSATMQILGSHKLSFSIGELKEISDMDKNGSGFSFADLAADRAGIQFAELATYSEDSANHLQNIIAASSSESVFLPDMFGLEEQLSLDQFTIEYEHTESKNYRATVAEIDRRIRLLPLYNGWR